jgi:RimJ/RimL family protein N-acetyltransferase
MLTFEPLGPAHVGLLAALAADPDVQRFTRVPAEQPEGFAADWARRYEEGRATGEREGFAARVGGELVGVAVAPHIDADAAEMELGYMVAPAHRGRGHAAAMLREITRWAFEDRAVRRAYLIIDVRNRASSAVAARCGYALEGVMRSIHVSAGRRIDAELWSRLPDDP